MPYHTTKIRYSGRKTGSSNERLLTRQNNVCLSGMQIFFAKPLKLRYVVLPNYLDLDQFGNIAKIEM